jgi:hypothetical protein
MKYDNWPMFKKFTVTMFSTIMKKIAWKNSGVKFWGANLVIMPFGMGQVSHEDLYTFSVSNI